MSRLKVSDEAKAQMSNLILHNRELQKFSSWEDYAEWLTRVSGISISKDKLWKLHQGNYQEVAFSTVYALTQFGNLRFPNGDAVSQSDFGAILYGEMDWQGKLLVNPDSLSSANNNQK